MLLLWMACREGGSAPTLEGFRGGVGYWPENSALAIGGVTRARLPAVSLDLARASDGVAMVLRGPSLDPSRCTWSGGAPLDAPLLVADFTASELEEQVWCGGLPQPGYPNALLLAEPPVRLDVAMAALRTSGTTAIRWMVEEPELVEVVLARWLALDPPNPLALSSRDPELLREAEAAFGAAGVDLTTALVGSPADADLLDAVVLGGASTPAEVRDARDAGLQVWVERDDPSPALDVDVVSTAYPGDGP